MARCGIQTRSRDKRPESRYDHAAWTSPESLVRDLRSDDDSVRSKALRAFGYPEAEMKDEIPKPDQIELRYSAIGDDATLDAIASVTVHFVRTYTAVAVPKASRWERIGTFFCWCKYEQDPLHSFVDVRRGPDGDWSELTLRPSGGGTGEYGRDEAHFRVHNGALRKVMSFVSFRRSCAPTGPCVIETRLLSGNQLVTSRERFEATSPPQNATCTPDEWDEKAFAWKRSGPSTKCSKQGRLSHNPEPAQTNNSLRADRQDRRSFTIFLFCFVVRSEA